MFDSLRLSALDHSPVSLTGQFTGEVWVKNGLSPSTFSTFSGRNLYRLLQPLDRSARCFLGVSLETSLIQRHRLIDQLVEEQLNRAPDTQVLEIAAGNSSRAQRMLERFPGKKLRYVESDLSSVVARKRSRLAESGLDKDPRYKLVVCNILREEGEESPEALLDSLDEKKPVLVLTEGLLNYFPLARVQSFMARIRDGLMPFPDARYITEIWPRLSEYSSIPGRGTMIRLIETVTRQRVPLHFEGDKDIADAVRQAGFREVKIIDPDTVDFPPDVPRMKKPALFRVIDARL